MNVNIIDTKHIHGKNLRDHATKAKNEELRIVENIVARYEAFRNGIDAINSLTHHDIREMVTFLNEYRRFSVPYFDQLDNSGQQALGYTIMEEFFFLLFEKKARAMELTSPSLFLGKGNSYVSLSFTPRTFDSIFANPNAYIHTKDQDFVLGVNVQIQVSADEQSRPTSTVIPVIAIECKTYLERNMLDSCAATASRLKNAMPYCIYIVASEYLKMTDAAPELTDIDEVYILCKAKNSDRERRKQRGEPPFDIDADLIIDLYERVERHLNATWWNPDDAVTNGKIINRP